MKKNNKFCEFDFLDLFYQKMIEKGRSHKLVRLSVNHEMVEALYDSEVASVTEEDLQKLADLCIANSWLKHTTLGTGKYGNLQLTATGAGVAKSRRAKREVLKNRSFVKRVSDYIEEHKGVFILLGFLVALAGVIVKTYGEAGNG